MPKAKITAETTETTEVIKQAQAAANDEPVLTPSENAAIQELTPHTLDAIDNQTETPPDKNLQHIQALEDAMAAIDQKIIVAEDRLAMLKSQKKDVKEQYLDAIKKEPTLYKSKLQNSFNF